jgi:hypothetical protein
LEGNLRRWSRQEAIGEINRGKLEVYLLEVYLWGDAGREQMVFTVQAPDDSSSIVTFAFGYVLDQSNGC